MDDPQPGPLSFRKVEGPLPKPEHARPFPMRLYIVGENADGTEICRFDLHATMCGAPATLHLPAQDIEVTYTR